MIAIVRERGVNHQPEAKSKAGKLTYLSRPPPCMGLPCLNAHIRSCCCTKRRHCRCCYCRSWTGKDDATREKNFKKAAGGSLRAIGLTQLQLQPALKGAMMV